jgi:outer membrane receptor protein involved in Fe transport
VGYKGTLGERVYITADAYINQLRNFVTDLLPGVNPAFPTFALDAQADVAAELTALDQRLAGFGLPANHPLRAPIPLLLGGYGQLQQGTTIQGGNALATLPGGSRAIVLSYTNAGKVTERGIELGVGYQFTPEVRADVSFTGFSFDVDEDELAAGDQLVPNTPSKKATFSLSYAGQQGFDGNVTLRLVDGQPWAAGIFQGYVPANELLNVSAGYRINNYVRVHATATNLFDQQRFQLYGGSVIGRRVLGGVTASF